MANSGRAAAAQIATRTQDHKNGRPLHRIPLADICSRLRDEHFGDELHPDDAGAKIIAEEVYKKLAPMGKAWQELPT